MSLCFLFSVHSWDLAIASEAAFEEGALQQYTSRGVLLKKMFLKISQTPVSEFLF